MGILGNYSVLHKSPGRFMSGVGNVVNLASFGKSGASRNAYFEYAKFNALPSGYVHPYCFVLAQSSGGMASFKLLTASASKAANLAGGINIEGSISGAIEITSANMGLIVQLVAAILGNGSLNNPNITGVLSGSSDMDASGILTPPLLGAIQDAIASLAASATITDSQLTALAGISADILPYTELSPEALARAVWSYMSSNPTDSGSMKDILEKAKQSADNAFAVSS